MSKKSRKRNKKILAAIGLGLGAMALSKRKNKADLASTEDGKSGSTKITGGTNSNDYDSGTKKTTPKKTTPKKNIPQDTKVNTGPKNPKSIIVKTNTNEVFKRKDGPDSSKVGNEKSNFKGEDGYIRRGVDAIPMTPGPRGTARAASEMSRGMLPPQLRKPKASQTFGSGNDGLSYMAKGGRVKGCGKALRGFGNAMKKGKR